MPSNYGTLAKAYISQDFTRDDLQQTVANTQPGNPLTLDLYILSYNSNKQLTTASKAGKASALKRAMNKNPTSVEQTLNERSTEVQPTNNQQPLTKNQEKKTLGKRLASDFSFPKEWEEFCQTERPELSPVKTFDQFKDYWIAQAGQKGVKLDWFATWRNWVRSTNAPKVNPADRVRLTVAPSNEPDPTLLKIKEDDLKASRPSLETLAKMAEIRRKA